MYYSRLPTALLSPTNEQTKPAAAALSSLQYEAGLRSLLPYLMRWIGEWVITAIRNSKYRCGLRDQLGDSVEGYPYAHSEREIVHGALCASFPLFSFFWSIEAVKTIRPFLTIGLFMWLHQILPPLLSTLLTSPLPINPPTLRGSAAETLRALVKQHGATYPTPRSQSVSPKRSTSIIRT